MRLGLLVPIWKRHELATFTLKHNLDNARAAGLDVDAVAVVSPGDDDAESWVAPGWDIVTAPNSPLSNKWNVGMRAFRDRGVDAVMILGSDDLIHQSVFEAMARDLDAHQHVDWWGVMDCFVLHGSSNRIAHWPGYPEGNPRHGEPIGTCRTFRAAMLEKIDWTLWADGLESGCDSAMRLDGFTHGITYMGQVGPILDIKAYPMIDLGSFWSMVEGPVLTNEQTNLAVEQIFNKRISLELRGITNPVARAVRAFDPDVSDPFISVCLMVKDEQEGISEALASLVGWADEVCVLDTGSTDATPEICEAWGCRVEREVFEQPFDFADGRNRSIRMAQGEWIFIMDGDEWVRGGETLADQLRALPDKVNCAALHHTILGRKQSDGSNRIFRFLRGSDVSSRNLHYIYPAHHQLQGIESFTVMNFAETIEPNFDAVGSAKRAIHTLNKRLMQTSAPGTKGGLLGPDGRALGGQGNERAHCLLYLARMHCIVADSMEEGEPKTREFELAALYAGKLIDEGTHSPLGYLTLLIAVERARGLQHCIPLVGKALERFPDLMDLYWWEMRCCAAMIATLNAQSPAPHPLIPQRAAHYIDHLSDCSKFLWMRFGPAAQEPAEESAE